MAHVRSVKKPIAVALLTFLPVLLLALIMPKWLTGTALIVVIIADMTFLRDVAYSLRDLKRERGTVPYRLRYPFFLFGAGFFAYCAISSGYISATAAPPVAVAAAAAIAASKLWLSTGPLWPYARKTAAA